MAPPQRRRAASGLFGGLLYPFQALAMLNRTPGLWRYVLVPVLVNIVVGATLYTVLLTFGWRAIDTLVAGLPAWAAIVSGLLHVLLVIALLIATGFVLVQFGVTLGAPWYAQLSERLEYARTGLQPSPGSGGMSRVLRDLGRAVVYALQKLLFVGVLALLVLLLNIIPVAGKCSPQSAGSRSAQPARISIFSMRLWSAAISDFGRNLPQCGARFPPARASGWYVSRS